MTRFARYRAALARHMTRPALLGLPVDLALGRESQTAPFDATRILVLR